MRPFLTLATLGVFASLFFGGCTAEPVQQTEEKKAQDTLPLWKPRIDGTFDGTPGALGVFRVPEMISLCKLDSAPLKDLPGKMKEDLAALENDFTVLHAEANGPQGVIYYNNTPGNFKFECLLPIKAIPAQTPQHSKLVVLEADYMLVYNHYGPYETSFKAYETIKQLIAANQLVQAGPLREFYPTGPQEQDPAKWLTRIMVPVTFAKQK